MLKVYSLHLDLTWGRPLVTEARPCQQIASTVGWLSLSSFSSPDQHDVDTWTANLPLPLLMTRTTVFVSRCQGAKTVARRPASGVAI